MSLSTNHVKSALQTSTALCVHHQQLVSFLVHKLMDLLVVRFQQSIEKLVYKLCQILGLRFLLWQDQVTIETLPYIPHHYKIQLLHQFNLSLIVTIRKIGKNG